MDTEKRSNPIVTRSMSRKSRRKNTKSKEAMGEKLNKIQLVGGGECYSHLTQEEFNACQKATEEMLSNAGRDKGPDYDKQQSDWLCTEYFPMIQKSRLEMADYILVEPMAVISILVGGCWAHMNFKAKPKDEDDSATSTWFAELNVPEKKVTKLVKLDIDLSGDTSAYKHCGFCHQDPEDDKVLSVCGTGCVYHPQVA